MTTHFELGDSQKTAMPTEVEEENSTPEETPDREEEPKEEKEKLIPIPLLGYYSKKQLMIIAGILAGLIGIYLFMQGGDTPQSQDFSQMRPVSQPGAVPAASAPETPPPVQLTSPPPAPPKQEEKAPTVDTHQLGRIDDELQALTNQVNAMNDKLTELENQKPGTPVASSKPKKLAKHHVTRHHTTVHKTLTTYSPPKTAVDIRQIHLLSLYPDLAWVRYLDSTYALHPGDSLAGLTVIAIDSHQRLVVTTAGNIH